MAGSPAKQEHPLETVPAAEVLADGRAVGPEPPPGETEARKPPMFSTYNGVFRPTILTILGVMMYLREGWMVGNAGLIGALLVILGCYLITGTTALSISSITTNIRVGAGGVFAIISQSLGLEVGGSVGIPLFLAQGLSAALYMQGIVETWMYLAPGHDRLLVTLGVFAVGFAVSSLSARTAFRVQAFVMLGLVLAVVSMLLGLSKFPIQENPVLWGKFEDGSLAYLFAVFFPAATGIMVGSSMSANLARPRRSIPLGTMLAWGLSLLVYLVMAVWYTLLGDAASLTDTSRIFAVEHAMWGWAVLLGIMASCFSATLSSLVAAPRVLQALSQHRIVPFSRIFEKEHRGEPRLASLFNGVLVLSVLLLGDLNSIAKILTMFFLVIYFMINLVLLIEHRLKMLSFRPRFRIGSWVPVAGTLSSLSAMIIISPLTALLAIVFALGIYTYLDHRQLETPWETVHSGLFASIANWAAKKVILNSRRCILRSWKPDLLVPVARSTQLEGYYRMIRALAYPQGTIQVACLHGRDDRDGEEFDILIDDFRNENMFATLAYVESTDFLAGLRSCISVKSGAFFRPNTLFTSIETLPGEALGEIMEVAKVYQMGVMLLAYHPETRLGRERGINLWVRDQSPHWHLGLELANLDYAILTGYQLNKNWGAHIRILCVVGEEKHLAMTEEYLHELMRAARMPRDIEIVVTHGEFWAFLDRAPRADLNIMGLSDRPEKAQLEALVQRAQGSCLFVRDSGNESALA